MTRARMFLSVYRTCNPRSVAFRTAWHAIRKG